MYKELIEDILDFWFRGCKGEDFPEERLPFWFNTSDEVKKLVKERFERDLNEAIQGKYDSWIMIPRGRLALLILLDQFSRNLYTGTSKETAQDAKALDISLKGIEAKQDQALTPIERVFFYLPIEHSEDINMQIMSVEVFETLWNSVSEKNKDRYEMFYKYALAHKRVLEQFGRFPYQNKAMGRKTTKEEEEFLREPGAPFFL